MWKFQPHRRRIPDCPAIMTWRYFANISRTKFKLGAVIHLRGQPAREHVQNVVLLAAVGFLDGLEALRPGPTGYGRDFLKRQIADLNRLDRDMFSRCGGFVGGGEIFLGDGGHMYV